jgi:preprotein translocase subunit SecF
VSVKSVLRDVYNGDNDFDFRPAWRVGMIATVVVVLGTVALLFTRGLNLGIDFEGGGVWEVPVTDVSVDDARSVMEDLGIGNAEIQFATNTADNTQILRVQTGTDALDQRDDITQGLAELAGVPTTDDVTVNTVGPSWGDEITKQAVRALVIFFIAIALYMSWRLEWRMALGALGAMVHDVLLSVGVYSLFGFEVTPATVVAFLTILGFSLYDTIVVFDKARDNTARLVGRQPYRFIMNKSLNQTLMRSVNTTLCTILPVGSLLLIGSLIFGAETLEDFALALFVGLTSGAYSSIFVAAPVVVWLKEREPRFAYAGEAAPRGSRRDQELEAETATDGKPARATTRRPTTRPTGTATTTAPTGAIPARPRKAKKRR